MSIGRNDPCPCGSGKKYKKCHGVLGDEPGASREPARANALKTLDTQLSKRLLRFARQQYGADWLQDVLEAEGLLVAGELSDAEMPFVIPWLLHFMVNSAELTLADEWGRHARRAISSEEQRLLDAYNAAWVSLWEVAEVTPGVGSRLTDVLTREERFVRDVSSTSTLQRFDTLLAIILTCDGVSFFGGIHSQPLPPRFAAVVTEEARRWCRVRTRPVSPQQLRDPDTQLELLALWNLVVSDMHNQPAPSLQNTDGDRFVLTKDDFALLLPRDEVADRLASLPGVQEPEQDGDDIVFVVTKGGNALHRSWDNTVVGRIVLSGTRLTVETNSTRRADMLRAAVERELEGIVRFRLRKEENTAQLMAAARAGAATRKERVDEPLPNEVSVALRQFREQHMKDWLDEAIPALDGLTPRDAARSPRIRPKLELLLKEFDQTEARLPEHQRIDLRGVREALGFL
ncbi:MAG: YecA family protein [Gemmatimonadaceae bacterium]